MITSLIAFLFALLILSFTLMTLQQKQMQAKHRMTMERRGHFRRSLNACEALLTTSPFPLPHSAKTILYKRKRYILEELQDLGEDEIDIRLTMVKDELNRLENDINIVYSYDFSLLGYDNIYQYCHNLGVFFDREINNNTSLSMASSKEKITLEKATVQCLFHDYINKGMHDKSLEVWGSARSYLEKALDLFVKYPDYTYEYADKREDLLSSVAEIQNAMWAIPTRREEKESTSDGLDRMFDGEKSKKRW